MGRLQLLSVTAHALAEGLGQSDEMEQRDGTIPQKETALQDVARTAGRSAGWRLTPKRKISQVTSSARPRRDGRAPRPVPVTF